MTALAAGVSPDGQKLFIAISKTIDQVTWSGPNIIVFNDVTISPPYKVDNVAGNPDSKQLTYVKKIVSIPLLLSPSLTVTGRKVRRGNPVFFLLDLEYQ